MAERNRGRAGRAIPAFGLVVALAAVAGAPQAGAVEENGADRCVLTEGVLGVGDLPAGSSAVDCRATGRVVSHEGVAVTVPRPGTAVAVEGTTATGEARGFQMEVAEDGTVSYDLIEHGEEEDTRASAGALSECSDGSYVTADRRWSGTYHWYLGDGTMPGMLSQSEAKAAFHESLDNITQSRNNCGYSDEVDADHAFVSVTADEADVSSGSRCTARDGRSTWDAGDLSGNFVAVMCAWSRSSPGVRNELKEADVRFNIVDFDFTNDPSSHCTDQQDIRSIGTHEAGHLFGLSHVGRGHSDLTMYGGSLACSTKARTLGKGDVLGLRSLY